MGGFFVSFLAGLAPMALYAWFLYFLDRYEKEPLRLLFGVFSWGAVIAAGAAFIVNSLSGFGLFLLTRSSQAAQLTLTTMVAPIVEESLKGVAVLLVFLVYRSDFDSPLDGVVYAGIAALGFGATENIWYIYRLGYLESGFNGLLEIAVVRNLLIGWQHPFYTAFTGVGFALSRNSMKSFWRWAFPLIGWSLAVFFHLAHNLLASFFWNRGDLPLGLIWDWSGYLGLLSLILLFILREQSWMKLYLSTEQERGIISMEQYRTASSAWRQSAALARSIISGNYRHLRRFYQICGDLMHKKRQLLRHGNHLGAGSEVQRLRSQLKSLAAALPD